MTTARIHHAETLSERLHRAAAATTIRQPGDTMSQGGWTRPTLVTRPAPRARATWVPFMVLLIVAALLTLAVVAIGAHA